MYFTLSFTVTTLYIVVFCDVVRLFTVSLVIHTVRHVLYSLAALPVWVQLHAVGF